jgi:hypothetical protein
MLRREGWPVNRKLFEAGVGFSGEDVGRIPSAAGPKRGSLPKG